MGGPGSGWQRSKKQTVEDGWTLSAAKLQRGGYLRANHRSTVITTWSSLSTGETLSTIGIEADAGSDSGSVRFYYTMIRNDEKLDYLVTLSTTPLPWGGLRWWFKCPLSFEGKQCRRRVDKLYLPTGGKYFGCRHCYQLTYTSCQESHKFDLCLAAIGAPRGLSGPAVARLLKRRWRHEKGHS